MNLLTNMRYNYFVYIFICVLFGNCWENNNKKNSGGKPIPTPKPIHIKNQDYNIKSAIDDINKLINSTYSEQQTKKIKDKIKQLNEKIPNEHKNNFNNALKHINNANKKNYKDELDKAIRQLELIIKVSDDYEQWIKILQQKETDIKYLPDYDSLYKESNYFKKQCDNYNHYCYFNELKSQLPYQIELDDKQKQSLNNFLKKNNIILIEGINVILQCNYCLKLYNNSNIIHGVNVEESEDMFEKKGQYFQYSLDNLNMICNNKSCRKYNIAYKIVPPFHPLIIMNKLQMDLSINAKKSLRLNDKKQVMILDVKGIMKEEGAYFTIANGEFNQS